MKHNKIEREYKTIKCCVPGCDSEKEAPLNVKRWYCGKCVANGIAWKYFYLNKMKESEVNLVEKEKENNNESEKLSDNSTK